ncbi:MAG: hypothetical protein ACOCRK_04175, partial [bacterium]
MALTMSDVVSAGMNGGVFITDITPLNTDDNIGNKVFSMDGKALDSCTTDTLNLKVHVLAFTGNTNYTPKVKVKGENVTGLNEIDNNGIFIGDTNISITEEDEKITASHEDGAVDSVDINYTPKPKITNAHFIGGYPADQTELKENDTFDLYVEANNDVVEIEIADKSAFKGLVTDDVSGTENTITGIIADRGNRAVSRYAKVRIKDTNGSWSNWYQTNTGGEEDGKHTVVCNNSTPYINITNIIYPENQQALKIDEIAKIEHTIENQDDVEYVALNDELKIHLDDDIKAWERPSVIASGPFQASAIKDDGTLVSWGDDFYNQVSGAPSDDDFIQVSYGHDHATALKEDGSLVSWGYDYDYENQIADTPSGNDFIQVSCGYQHSTALKEDGSLVSWGYDNENQVSDTPSGNDFVQVSCGQNHITALKEDGSLVSWGLDNNNQVSDTPTGNDFVQVSCGYYHITALKEDGSLVSWGKDGTIMTDIPTGNDFVQVSSGFNHATALKEDGSLVSWGSDDYNQVGDTPTDSNFALISCGGYHTLALRDDGTLVAWGRDNDNEVSDTPTNDAFIHVSCGMYHTTAIKEGGSLVSWGGDGYNQISDTPSDNDFVQINCGQYHATAIKEDGTLVVWGWDNYNVVTDTPTSNDFVQASVG